MKAYEHKQSKEDRDSYQTDELVSMSPKHGGHPTKTFLIAMHLI